MNVRTFTRLALRSPAMATVLGLATLRPTMLQRLAITSAVLAATALALPASATVATFASVYTVGNYYDAKGNLDNRINGGTQGQPDGSVIGRVGCVPAEQGGIGCSYTPPLQITEWWQRENVPTLAAGQAKAAFGTNSARSIVTNNALGGITPTPAPGHREYGAIALSRWQDEVIYLGAARTLVTLEFRVHAQWKERGRFRLNVGAGFGCDPDASPRCTTEHALTNCPSVAAADDGCDYPDLFGNYVGFPGVQMRYVNGSGEDNGLVDELFRFDVWVNPFMRPGRPDRPSDLLVELMTWGILPDAETDAFSTVKLERIFVDDGVSLSFKSGSAFPLVVRGDVPGEIPAPGTGVLGLAALGALAWVRRRDRMASASAGGA